MIVDQEQMSLNLLIVLSLSNVVVFMTLTCVSGRVNQSNNTSTLLLFLTAGVFCVYELNDTPVSRHGEMIVTYIVLV